MRVNTIAILCLSCCWNFAVGVNNISLTCCCYNQALKSQSFSRFLLVAVVCFDCMNRYPLLCFCSWSNLAWRWCLPMLFYYLKPCLENPGELCGMLFECLLCIMLDCWLCCSKLVWCWWAMKHDDDCLLQFREPCIVMFLLVLFWCFWHEAHWVCLASCLMMMITWWLMIGWSVECYGCLFAAWCWCYAWTIAMLLCVYVGIYL